MSLMQLLTVGRSFGSVEDRPSPYRMVQDNLLPKFGAADRAGARPAVAEPGTAESSGCGETKMNAIETPSQAAPNASAAFPPQAYPAGRWTLMRNPFQRRTAPAKTPTLVQGELSLDAVRPVRNDLNESDLEVVPARAAEPAGADGSALTRKTGVAATFLWHRLRTRLLKRT